MVAIVQLALVWTMYFDNFLHVSTQTLCKHSDLIISVFFHCSVGACPVRRFLSTACKALGIMIDLRQVAFGTVRFTNTESRRAELLRCLELALDSGKMHPKECEGLKGRLHFAVGQLFGRKARSCLTVLGEHARQRSQTLRPAALEACEHLHDLFLLGEVFHCHVDTSYEPGGGYSRVGGCLLSGSGNPVAWFGCPVGQDVLDFILEAGVAEKDSAIYELE